MSSAARRSWHGLAVAAAATIGFASWPARADNPTTVVLWVEGPHADEARAEISKSLSADVLVVDPTAWHDAFRRGAPAGPLGRELAKPKTRSAVLESAAHAAGDAHVGEVVLVSTSRSKGRHIADAYLVTTDRDPEVLSNLVFGGTSPALGLAVHDRIVASHPATSAIPPPSSPSPAPAPAEAPVSLAASGSNGPVADTVPVARGHRTVHQYGRELLDVSGGGEVGGRQFSYHDPFTGNLRSYQLGAAPLFVVAGAVYPLADSSLPVLSDLGVVAGYAQAFATHSDANAGSVGTQWYRWHAGGRLRIRTGGPSAPVLGVSGDYGSESFTFDSSDPAGTYPSATYDFVRAGADVRVPLGRFAITGGGGYMGVLSAGETASRYPHASVGGVDFGLGGTIAIVSGLEARLCGSYRRFFYAMNPVPGAEFVAGGALDEMWGVTAIMAYVY